MSRLTIGCFLFYGRFTGRFVVVKHTVKQTAHLFLSLDTQDIERGQSDVPRTAPEAHAVFSCVYLFARSHMNFFVRVGPKACD